MTGQDISSVEVCFNHHQADQAALVIERLESGVSWSSERLDVAVLQLRVPFDHQLPPSLGCRLGDVRHSSKFHLIGHNDGGYKAVNLCCEKRPADHPDVQNLQGYPEWTRMFPSLLDPCKTLLEASLTHGSSGSPCFDDSGRLVLMQAHGLFLGDSNVLDQGVNLIDIFQLMNQEAPALANLLRT